MAEKDVHEIVAPEVGAALPTPARVFDPSAVDVEDPDQTAGLTEEQLEAAYAHAEKTGKIKPYVEGAEQKDEVPVPGAEAEADTATLQADTTGQAAGVANAPSGEQGKYAGKYGTVEDLAKGVYEAAKVLGLSPSALTPVVDAALKSKDISAVESLYRELDSEIGKRGSTRATTAPEAGAEGQAPTPTQVTSEDSPQVVNAVMGAAVQQLMDSDLARQFAAKGYAMPKTQEEFDALADTAPYLAMRYQQEFRDLFSKNMAIARERIKAEREVEGHNAKVIDSDLASVREYAGKYGIQLDDQTVANLKTAVLADIAAYEDRHGVRFLKNGAVMDHFMAKSFPGMMDRVLEVARQKAAEDAMQKLEASRKAVVRTVSTSGRASTERAKPKAIDLNDPDQLAQLSDEELARIS